VVPRSAPHPETHLLSARPISIHQSRHCPYLYELNFVHVVCMLRANSRCMKTFVFGTGKFGMTTVFHTPSYNYMRVTRTYNLTNSRAFYAPFPSRPSPLVGKPQSVHIVCAVHHSGEDAAGQWYREDASSGDDLMQLLREKRPGKESTHLRRFCIYVFFQDVIYSQQMFTWWRSL